MMDQVLDRCDGAIDIANDMIVHGKDDKEHNQYLCMLMHIAHEYGLVFNSLNTLV